ncbi:MAG: glycosyltransferase family 4 protein [Candidatus Omnitrophica bacterium]|nr:glycosyltransferase family 4 protein [Candidatus Omnitrophota bacterium]MCF7896220.1 glycosyltransferase family 4 protein [Candidatus Omnitrophota bacterium]MCF7897208.1 glycosyltransferase family 4 protein [Candidatus Omnitrophota bacterium]
MRILMVHPHDLFHNSEPWTIRIKSIAFRLKEKGHQVKLVHFPFSANQAKQEENKFSIETIPLNRAPCPVAFLKNTQRLKRAAEWADILHFQKCHHYAAVSSLLAGYLTGTPLHYDWDDWEEKIWYESCGKGINPRFIGFSFKILESWLPVLAETVSCASAYLKSLSKRLGVKSNCIFDAPVGADLERFRPSLDGSRIKKQYDITGDLVLYVGQLHGAQYVDSLIKAANVVLHRRPDAKFLIVGEGFMEPFLRQLVCELGLEQKVIFTGSIPYQQVPYYLAAASVCVAPFNDTEVTRCKSPLKIAEYLAGGKAIVASNVGEVRKMVGGAGILVVPGDQRGLADGITRLLEDKILRKKLEKFARRRAESRYNWAYTTDSLLSAYQKNIRLDI